MILKYLILNNLFVKCLDICYTYNEMIISQEHILETKTKLTFTEGYNTLVFVDGKFVEFINKPKIYQRNTKVVSICSTPIKLLWGTREKLAFNIDNNILHIGLSGDIEIEISNARKFYNDVLLTNKNINLTNLQTMIVPYVVSQLDVFAKKFINKNNLKVIDFEAYKYNLSRHARLEISEVLERKFGITCKSFTIQRVLFDDEELGKVKKSEQYNLLIEENNVMIEEKANFNHKLNTKIEKDFQNEIIEDDMLMLE